MSKKIMFLSVVFGLLVFVRPAYGQMMMQRVSVSPQVQQLSTEDKEDIQEGQVLYDRLRNHETECQRLDDEDFDKIGEYVFQKSIGDESTHAQMNEMMRKKMGDDGEQAMHEHLGRRETGCDTGRNGMWSESDKFHAFKSPLLVLVELAIVVDLILIGRWFLLRSKK